MALDAANKWESNVADRAVVTRRNGLRVPLSDNKDELGLEHAVWNMASVHI